MIDKRKSLKHMDFGNHLNFGKELEVCSKKNREDYEDKIIPSNNLNNQLVNINTVVAVKKLDNGRKINLGRPINLGKSLDFGI